MTWRHPDIELIADKAPGTLLLHRADLPAGGNDVLSYLDVAAPDSLGIEGLWRLLLASPPPTSFEVKWVFDSIALRFSAHPSRDLSSEFEALRKHALRLLLRADETRPKATSERPLKILAQDVPGMGVVYQLDQESSARLVTTDEFSASGKVYVEYQQMDEIKKLWGAREYHAQIALVLTGMTQEAIHAAGGYQVVHVSNPDIDHPKSLRPTASARDIPGQIDGYWVGPQSTTPPDHDWWPTGALLLSQDGARALDLVFVESAWFPISEAALYTYSHSSGLQGGESWRFVVRNSDDVFEIGLGPSLTVQEVEEQYGSDAAARSRTDHRIVQLLVSRLPRQSA